MSCSPAETLIMNINKTNLHIQMAPSAGSQDCRPRPSSSQGTSHSSPWARSSSTSVTRASSCLVTALGSAGKLDGPARLSSAVRTNKQINKPWWIGMGLTLSGWQVIFGCFCQLYNSAESFVLRMFSLQTLYYILGENIALGQPATQSDTLWDFGPGQTLNIHRTHKFSSCHCGTLIHQFRQLHWSDQSGFGFIENCYSDSFIFSGMKYESFLHMMMTGIPDVKTFLTKFSNIFKPCWQFWNMPVSVAVPSLVSLIKIQALSVANIIQT